MATAEVGQGGMLGPEVPGMPQRRSFLPTFVLAWFGANLVLGTLAGAVVPKMLARSHPVSKESVLAWIIGIGGVVVIVTTPLFGRLSDRTRSRHGMRRPWMVWGVLAGMAGVALMAFTTSIPLLALGWCVVQAGFGAAIMAQHALLADQIPASIRARVSAAVSIAAGVSVAVGTGLVSLIQDAPSAWWFLVPGLLGATCCLGLVWSLEDRVLEDRPAPLRPADVVSTYWLDPREHRDFAWAWVCRFLVTMSIVAVVLNLFYLVLDRLHVSADRASAAQATIIGAYLVTSFASAAVCGWLSDRTGRRKRIIWLSCLLTSLGLLGVILAPSLAGVVVAYAVIGAGQGAYVSVDVALMTEVLPSFADAGKDLGIVALSYQVPQVLAPALAAGILSLGGGANYPTLYAVAIVLCVAGGLAVLPIRSVR
jgi:MFS family permease